MPGLVPGIHIFANQEQGAGGRDKPCHDDAIARMERSDCGIGK
jgi:hypothetical protein